MSIPSIGSGTVLPIQQVTTVASELPKIGLVDLGLVTIQEYLAFTPLIISQTSGQEPHVEVTIKTRRTEDGVLKSEKISNKISFDLPNPPELIPYYNPSTGQLILDANGQPIVGYSIMSDKLLGLVFGYCLWEKYKKDQANV
jgi:hypothetical protein